MNNASATPKAALRASCALLATLLCLLLTSMPADAFSDILGSLWRADCHG